MIVLLNERFYNKLDLFSKTALYWLYSSTYYRTKILVIQNRKPALNIWWSGLFNLKSKVFAYCTN